MVGVGEAASLSVTPCPAVCVHAYVSGSPFGSSDPVPSSCTGAPKKTVWSTPASATGGNWAVLAKIGAGSISVVVPGSGGATVPGAHRNCTLKTPPTEGVDQQRVVGRIRRCRRDRLLPEVDIAVGRGRPGQVVREEAVPVAGVAVSSPVPAVPSGSLIVVVIVTEPSGGRPPTVGALLTLNGVRALHYGPDVDGNVVRTLGSRSPRL